MEIEELLGYEEEVEVASKINEIIKNIRNVSNTSDEDKPISTATQEAIDGINAKVDAISFMPDYSKGISVSLPYTVTSSGFMFIQVSGYDWWHFATVNNKRVGASVGYSGGKEVGNGVVFPVSEGDVVSGSAYGAYFYPMKGAN